MYYFYTWGGAARNTTLTLNGYRVKFLSWGGISGSTWLYHDGAWYYVQKYSCVTNGWYQIDQVIFTCQQIFQLRKQSAIFLCLATSIYI